MFKIILILGFVIKLFALNFRLNSKAQKCILINGLKKYQFQFISSGQSENNVSCKIYDDNTIIKKVQYQSQYQTVFEITSNTGKICFGNLDTLSKVISFDFIEEDDPIKNKFTDKRKQQSHQLLYHAYRQVDELYRDQHFLLSRRHVHNSIINEAQFKLFTTSLAKLFIIGIAAFFQLIMLKKVVNYQKQSVQTQQQL